VTGDSAGPAARSRRASALETELVGAELAPAELAPADLSGADLARAAALAAEVVDPELPVLTVGELGILRRVLPAGRGGVAVELTPTYSGCPAVEVIVADVRATLSAAGYEPIEVRLVRDPPWSSAWISPAGREKLRAAGLSVGPPTASGEPADLRSEARPATPSAPVPPSGGPVDLVRCPACGSLAVRRLSPFGPTACTALYSCRDCAEPFEHLKAVS